MRSITFFLSFIPVLALILLGLNLIFAPHSPYQEKSSTFECGFHSFLGQNRTQFSISFFVFGLLFIIFDLELVLVYPAALTLNTNEGYGLAVMILFLSVLTLGFAFELGKKALNIESRQYDQTRVLKSSLQKSIILFFKNYIRPYIGTIITFIIAVILLNWENEFISLDNLIIPSFIMVICKLLIDFIRHRARIISKYLSVYVAVNVVMIKFYLLYLFNTSFSLLKDVHISEYIKCITITDWYFEFLDNKFLTIIAILSVLRCIIPYRAIWNLITYLYKTPYSIMCSSPILTALGLNKTMSKPESPVSDKVTPKGKLSLSDEISPIPRPISPILDKLLYRPKIPGTKGDSWVIGETRTPPTSKVVNSRLPGIEGDGYCVNTDNNQHVETLRLDMIRMINRCKNYRAILAENKPVIAKNEKSILNMIRAYIDGKHVLEGRKHLFPAVNVVAYKVELGGELNREDVETLNLVALILRERLYKKSVESSELPHFPNSPK